MSWPCEGLWVGAQSIAGNSNFFDSKRGIAYRDQGKHEQEISQVAFEIDHEGGNCINAHLIGIGNTRSVFSAPVILILLPCVVLF